MADAGEYDYAILDELRSIGRKLDSLTKLAEKQASAYDAIAERIATAVSDIPKRPAALTDKEPPIGSQVMDRDGDRWERSAHGWGAGFEWGDIQKYGPFVLTRMGDGDV